MYVFLYCQCNTHKEFLHLTFQFSYISIIMHHAKPFVSCLHLHEDFKLSCCFFCVGKDVK